MQRECIGLCSAAPRRPSNPPPDRRLAHPAASGSGREHGAGGEARRRRPMTSRQRPAATLPSGPQPASTGQRHASRKGWGVRPLLTSDTLCMFPSHSFAAPYDHWSGRQPKHPARRTRKAPPAFRRPTAPNGMRSEPSGVSEPLMRSSAMPVSDQKSPYGLSYTIDGWRALARTRSGLRLDSEVKGVSAHPNPADERAR
jgi:hypothetical protein